MSADETTLAEQFTRLKLGQEAKILEAFGKWTTLCQDTAKFAGDLRRTSPNYIHKDTKERLIEFIENAAEISKILPQLVETAKAEVKVCSGACLGVDTIDS